MDEISLVSSMNFVYMSSCHPSHSLYVASLKLATSQPGHRVFACLLIAPEGLGNEFHWKMSAFGSGFIHEIFSQFHPHLPPEKAKCPFCLAWPPLPSGFLLSTLAPKWAALTLNLCTQHCVPVSHLHVPHQNFTSTHFSTAYEVLSSLTQLLMASTVH